ncbi:MAG: ferritin [Phenylobacterium sp.]|jgi:ferritin
MLKQEMIDNLNSQLNLEFYSSNLYLQMAGWCDDHGFEGCAEFMHKHADEEMSHMNRLFSYLSDSGALPLIGTIAAPPHEFNGLAEIFQKTYEHECLVTEEINRLAHTANMSQDYSTFNFLQWYVAEQHEEEKLFKGILDKIQMVGDDGKALFFIDKDLAELAKTGCKSIMTPADH